MSHRLRRRVAVAHDIIVAVVSLPIALSLRDSPSSLSSPQIAQFLCYSTPLFCFIIVSAFFILGVNRNLWRFTGLNDLMILVKASTISISIFYAVLFLIDRLILLPRSVPFIHWLVLTSILCGSRIVYASAVHLQQSRSHPLSITKWEPVLLVGAGNAGAFLVHLLRTSKHLPFEVVGFLDDRPSLTGCSVHGVPVLGCLGDLSSVALRLSLHGIHVTRVILTHSSRQIDSVFLEKLYRSAQQCGIHVDDIGGFLRCADSDVKGILETLENPERSKTSVIISSKRIIDILLTGILIIALLPFMIIIAIAVWINLGRPVIFYQVRPGRDLQTFKVYKFRTLKEGHLPDGRILDDKERQTSLGCFLRRTRLDELPQLWNVLKGDMALIGPRPLLLRDLPQLSYTAVHERFSVRPGITGWAQVNGGHLLRSEQKLALDLWYIRCCTILLDIKIIISTIVMMITGEKINHTAVDLAFRYVQDYSHPIMEGKPRDFDVVH